MSAWTYVRGIITVRNFDQLNPKDVLKTVMKDAPNGSEGGLVGVLTNSKSGYLVCIVINSSLRDFDEFHSWSVYSGGVGGRAELERWIKSLNSDENVYVESLDLIVSYNDNPVVTYFSDATCEVRVLESRDPYKLPKL